MPQSETKIIAQKQPTVFGGIMLTAGVAIGAGIFTLPTVSSGMWFGWSMFCMILSWFSMYHASLYILEVNLHFHKGASFDTLVKETLGKKVNAINGLLFLFLMYILDYAFISSGGAIVEHTFMSSFGFAPSRIFSGLLFAGSLSFVVWISTKAVDRVVTVLFLGMIVTFFMTMGDLSLTVNFQHLFDNVIRHEQTPYFYFVFAALPFYLASFGFYSIVPSMVKYYDKNHITIRKSLLYGSLITFCIYVFWLMSTLGNLQREAFLPVIAAGGNVDALIQAINHTMESEGLLKILNIFANLAIISSFFGVSIGLFEFIADKFNIPDTRLGRTKTALLAFIPPSLGGVFFPDGFIYAIGFAGLVLAFNGLIIPPLMAQKSRKIFTGSHYPGDTYKVWGGNGLIYFMIAMGVLYATCHILAMMNILPVYGVTS